MSIKHTNPPIPVVIDVHQQRVHVIAVPRHPDIHQAFLQLRPRHIPRVVVIHAPKYPAYPLPSWVLILHPLECIEQLLLVCVCIQIII